VTPYKLFNRWLDLDAVQAILEPSYDKGHIELSWQCALRDAPDTVTAPLNLVYGEKPQAGGDWREIYTGYSMKPFWAYYEGGHPIAFGTFWREVYEPFLKAWKGR
jgi:hypothetical protein